MQKNIAGKQVEIDQEGFLVKPQQWNEDVAEEIAKELNIELTDKHWEVIDYLRSQHAEGVEISIRKVGKSGVVDIKGLYSLFPGGPLKNASKIAGLSRPASCV
jgi:tRNA 2-thiouridine synthesizing protein E